VGMPRSGSLMYTARVLEPLDKSDPTLNVGVKPSTVNPQT